MPLNIPQRTGRPHDKGLSGPEYAEVKKPCANPLDKQGCDQGGERDCRQGEIRCPRACLNTTGAALRLGCPPGGMEVSVGRQPHRTPKKNFLEVKRKTSEVRGMTLCSLQAQNFLPCSDEARERPPTFCQEIKPALGRGSWG